MSDIKTKVESIGAKMNAPLKYLPTYGNSNECHPFIEIDENVQLCYKIYERGKKIKNEYAVDKEDLCCRIFADIIFSMALEYELHNRIEGQDSRRRWFVRQLELPGKLNPDWREKKRGTRTIF